MVVPLNSLSPHLREILKAVYSLVVSLLTGTRLPDVVLYSGLNFQYILRFRDPKEPKAIYILVTEGSFKRHGLYCFLLTQANN